MLFLAKAIMKDPNWSLMICAGLGAATLVFSPVGFLAGAAIALVTLAAGLTPGARALGATLIAGFVVGLLQGAATQVLIASVEFWLAGFALAVVLGYTGSLARAIGFAVLAAFVVMLLAYTMMSPSPEAVWAGYIEKIVTDLQTNGVYLDPESEAMFKEQMPASLTMLMLMGLLAVWSAMLFLARWWQRALYPQQGTSFGAEFRALRLPNGLALVFFAAFVALLFLPDVAWVTEVTAILTLAFMLQGLAVLHHWVFVKNSSTLWLVVVYAMLAVLPHFMMMVAVLGWMEHWLDWRSKLEARH